MRRFVDVAIAATPFAPAIALFTALASVWAYRFGYPFDLEWMEGGMLAHAWRVNQGLPLYVRPNTDFMPFIYPPGYTWVVAGLSQIFGLWMQVGRAVSIASILATAAALGFGLRRAGGSRAVAFGTAVAFLGTYAQSGAFFDIVRPDSLGLALFAWAIVLGLEDRPSAPVAAGLLLAASFLVKQNAAAAGVPMLLGFALRGWRPALAFAGASIAPALGAVALLQWASDGQFLVWVVGVPAAQNMDWSRAWVQTPREWGTALPVACGVAGLALCWDATSRQRTFPTWLVAGLPVWLGMVFAWWFTYEPPPPDALVYNTPASFAYWAIVAIPAAVGFRVLTAGIERIRGTGELPPWRGVYAVGILLTTGVMATLMRVHDGGYTNVHMPMFWCLAAALGAVLVGLERARPQPSTRGLVAGLLAIQLWWSLAILRPARFIPSPEDVAMGWSIVDEVRGIDGPVLSPFSAWIPYYAGQAPSLHAQAVWDVDYKGGPYQDDLVVIEEALRAHHWAMIIGGQSAFLGDLTKHYEVREELIPVDDPRFTPRTGMVARPWRILVPRP